MDTTVVKGFRVLEALARADAPMRVSDVAAALELQRSNAHRLLATLSELGYVEQEPATGRYRPTLRMWEYGAGIVARHPLKRIAGPYMQELHKATGETVSLTVLDGIEVIYIDKLVSPRPLRFTTQPGSRTAALFSVSGRAMLAHEPDMPALVKRAIESHPQGHDLDPDAFTRELEAVRGEGFAILESRFTPGLVGIASPIIGREGRAAGALTISGPIQRFREKARAAAAEALLNACARIADAGGPL